MLKELTIAILLGALIGFAATTSFINLKNKNSVTPDNQISSDQIISNTPTTSQNQLIPTLTNHHLTITSPNTDTVVNDSKLTIKGQTSPNSLVLIHTSIDTFFPEVDDTGLFQQQIELEAGANLIQISSLSTTEEQIDKEILITFSTAEF